MIACAQYTAGACRIGFTVAVLGCVACGGAGAPRPEIAPAPRVSASLGDSSAATDVADGKRTRIPADSGAARKPGLTSEDWAGRPVGRVEELFVGRFPGVQVFSTSRGLSVRVGGATSLMARGEPLYVIDGIAVEPGPDGLLDMNPHDIERIEVLKDATSIAEYGMRGASGVVKIRTKHAK